MIYIIIGSIFIILLLICFGLALFIHHQVFGKRWDPDGTIKYYELSEFDGLMEEPFEISYHQEALKGFYYRYSYCSKDKLIVLAHGMWGSHKAYMQEIEYFCRNGFTVLGFDYKGTDLSTGKSLGGLGESLACLDAVLNYLEKKYPTSSISVFGHSWGGFAAINIAQYHPHLSHVIAMAPFVNLRRVLCCLLPKKIWFLIPFLIGIDMLYCGKYSVSNGLKTLKNTKIKTFIIHSIDDMMVRFPYNTGYLEKKLKNSNVFIYKVNGKNHNPDYTTEAILYTKGAMEELKCLPKERQNEYYSQLNFHKMGELDEEIMNIFIDFLK